MRLNEDELREKYILSKKVDMFESYMIAGFCMVMGLILLIGINSLWRFVSLVPLLISVAIFYGIKDYAREIKENNDVLVSNQEKVSEK